ncbi:aminoglycoside phosphotransferase [Spirochaetia bacterium]|nr:aminoglycoside phosphotransferase [Spirochaetia bacterium]
MHIKECSEADVSLPTGMNGQLIAGGAQADVFLDDGKALKVFKYPISETDVQYEADLQRKAFEYGLPVPKIYGITKVNGKRAIVMEYLNGASLGEKILQNKETLLDYLAKSVDIQINIHSYTADNFPAMKERSVIRISSTDHLDKTQKDALLKKISEMKFDNKLCHGDFHVNNLIETKEGIRIIDWVDASAGTAAADVCRSYLLYYLNAPELAEVYLNLYCEKTSMTKEEIFLWEPIIAGIRLTEGVSEKEKNQIQGILKKYL